MGKQKKTLMLLFAIAMVITIVGTVKADTYYVGIAGFQASDLAATVRQAREHGGRDTIYVGVGVYKLDEELIIDDVLIGGCISAGSGGVVRKYPGAVGNESNQQTILDGNSFVRVMPSLKHRVATVNMGAVLEGCVIRNGHARGTTNNPTDMSGFGGGVLVNGGKLHNSILRGNVAMNMAYSSTNPGKGGGVFVTDNGGEVVNCIITFNMDDTGLGVDGNAGSIVNNTISRNTNAPKYILIPGNMSGTPEFRHYAYAHRATTSTMTAPYIRLDDFYTATTETTQGQYACFLTAVDLNSSLAINQAEWKAMCGAKTPMYGYTDIVISKYLGIASENVNTPPTLIATGTTGLYMGINNSAGSGKEVYYPNKETSKYSADPLVRDNFPMLYVSWYGAVAFSVWLGGMLPTEAQWEYAARRTKDGIQTSAAYAGNKTDLNAVAWNTSNSASTPHEVAKLSPTQYGLYDMNGNAFEWTCDWYNGKQPHNAGGLNYPSGNSVSISSDAVNGCYSVSLSPGVNGSTVDNPVYNPIYNYPTAARVARGGSWNNRSGDINFFPLGSRVTVFGYDGGDGNCCYGMGTPPTLIDNATGFRTVGCINGI